MYDQWSEDMEYRILTQLETEVIYFAKSCLEHENKRNAKKVLMNQKNLLNYSRGCKYTATMTKWGKKIRVSQ